MLNSLTSYQLNSLSENQIQSLSMDLLEKILAKTTLTPSQIQALTPKQLSQLTTDQLQSMASSLSDDQIKSLPLKQVQDLPTVAAAQTIKDFSIAQVAFNTEASNLIQKILNKLSLVLTGLPKQEIGSNEGKGPWLVTWDQSKGTLGYTHEKLTVSENALQQASRTSYYSSLNWHGD